MFNGNLKILLLGGGQSSRMGTDKLLLPIGDHILYVRQLHKLQTAFPAASDRHISLHSSQELEMPPNVNVIVDEETERIGPAAGLVAAYNHDRTAYWAVLACDYPLIVSEELSRLATEFSEPVTCFRNDEGFVEPLIGIWSPQALQRLKENVTEGILGPSRTFKELDGKNIAARDVKMLFNANTPEEWAYALAHISGT